MPNPPADPPVLRVLLVRHGESTWNAIGRWQGQADPPLSQRGREQARAAAAAIPPLDAVVASSLVRAHETARLLAEPHGHEVAVDGDLRERNAGEFTGLTRAEIDARYPTASPAHPEFQPPDGWEPEEAVLGRAMRSLERLANGQAATVLAVTHGGVIHAVERALGAPRAGVSNLEGRWIERCNGDWIAGRRELLLDPQVATRSATP